MICNISQSNYKMISKMIFYNIYPMQNFLYDIYIQIKDCLIKKNIKKKYKTLIIIQINLLLIMIMTFKLINQFYQYDKMKNKC